MISVPLQKRSFVFSAVYAMVFCLLGPLGAWPIASKAASVFPESKRWANGLKVTKILVLVQVVLFIHIGYQIYEYVVNFRA